MSDHEQTHDLLTSLRQAGYSEADIAVVKDSCDTVAASADRPADDRAFAARLACGLRGEANVSSADVARFRRTGIFGVAIERSLADEAAR